MVATVVKPFFELKDKSQVCKYVMLSVIFDFIKK